MSSMVKGEPQTDDPLASANVRTNLDALFESDVESLRVRAQTSPDMTVAVEDDNNRSYVSGNTPLDFAGGNSPSFTAPLNASEKQIDLLTLDSSGTLAITNGTPTTGTPAAPTYPGDKLVLAEIFLRKDMASIKNTDDATNGYIFKARTPVFNLGGGFPTGGVMPYGGSTEPNGFLFCDGEAHDATADTSKQALFDVIGNTFGGSDNTDFQTPDMRGRFPLGKDNMGGVGSANRVTDSQADNVGQSSGAENKLLAHSHNHTHAVTRSLTQGGSTEGIGEEENTTNTTTELTDADATSAGSGSSSMNPYLTLNYIIKK